MGGRAVRSLFEHFEGSHTPVVRVIKNVLYD